MGLTPKFAALPLKELRELAGFMEATIDEGGAPVFQLNADAVAVLRIGLPAPTETGLEGIGKFVVGRENVGLLVEEKPAGSTLATGEGECTAACTRCSRAPDEEAPEVCFPLKLRFLLVAMLCTIQRAVKPRSRMWKTMLKTNMPAPEFLSREKNGDFSPR